MCAMARLTLALLDLAMIFRECVLPIEHSKALLDKKVSTTSLLRPRSQGGGAFRLHSESLKMAVTQFDTYNRPRQTV